MDDSLELRKDRFFFGKKCAYCCSNENLMLDSIAPFTWVDEGVWILNEWDFKRLFVTEVQILCDSCLRRKKQVWKRAKKEGGEWIAPYLEIPSKAITKVVD